MFTRHKKLLGGYKNTKWKDWQKEIIDICDDKKTDNRTIHWFWETEGNVGKSFLAKYLVLKYDAVIADGKKDNVFNQINNKLNIEEKEIKVVLLDVPRHNLQYINYGALEQIKNGMLYSGKYEGGTCLFESPKLIVFANQEPERTKMSLDRWKIRQIGNVCSEVNMTPFLRQLTG